MRSGHVRVDTMMTRDMIVRVCCVARVDSRYEVVNTVLCYTGRVLCGCQDSLMDACRYRVSV